MRTAARTCANMGVEASVFTLVSNFDDAGMLDGTFAVSGAGEKEGRGTDEREPGNATKLRRLDSSLCCAASSSKFCQLEPMESRSGQPALHGSKLPSSQRKISSAAVSPMPRRLTACTICPPRKNR